MAQKAGQEAGKHLHQCLWHFNLCGHIADIARQAHPGHGQAQCPQSLAGRDTKDRAWPPAGGASTEEPLLAHVRLGLWQTPLHATAVARAGVEALTLLISSHGSPRLADRVRMLLSGQLLGSGGKGGWGRCEARRQGGRQDLKSQMPDACN
jgi:hypothetical protein